METKKEPIWNQFLTERDKQVFAAAGYGARQGFGKRPALIIVDVNYAFCGDKPEPILESIKRWRNSCGEEAWDGVAAIAKLVEACRAKGLPILYTTGTRRADNWDAGSWSWKNRRNGEAPRTIATNRDGNDIVDEIAPGPQDIVIEKLKPSGFEGTPMASFLTLLGADSVLVTGTTTSGCVRATVLDAFSLNYRIAVVEEGCFDRSQASHAINLCDMHAKYADVVALEETLAFIGGLPDGLFELPSGQGMRPYAAAAE
ncbi:isochorismatase family protein [Roseomonas sp. OT10]|uniref:isochorismatase family protein n=1 Tax=Roseomonas cutis TaxID=2897332 RepID=UPI001E3024AA|nr:isochorismatase family protein [Roseomonas sp. OT10]UFN46934.1 isochorismatase family protein [Roseomonas sp. OT10]